MKIQLNLMAMLVALLIAYGTFAQDFSNKGKDFWLVYPAHIDGNNSRMALYISSDVNTTGTVYLNGSTIAFSVTANQATVVQIFPTTYPVINAQNEGVNAGKGIHIVSQNPVVVYAHLLNAARSGSTLVLPTNTLGREYIVASFKSSNNSNSTAPNGSNAGSQFTLVAVENNTTVEITPSVTDVGGVRPAGTPYTITLNQGDVYQFRTTYTNDVTGTKIRSIATSTTSCKPLAVFSGSSWTSMDCANASGGDNLFLQLMPQSAWGKNYITAPFADRQYDIFRIIVKDPTTVVTLNGSVLPTSSLVNSTYYQFSSSAPNSITSDKPIMVVQYMISQTCDTRNNNSTSASAPYPGDPEMVILNSVEQTLNDVTVVSARNNLTPPNTNISKHFFTIIMKSNATSSLRIDGNLPAGTFIPIGSTGYSYLQENVTASTNSNPSHRIKADSGFIALAYGMGTVESYGYNAGTNVRDLYQFVAIQNQYATVSFPAACRNSPFFFSMTFPYQPTQIEWQFNGLFPNVLINNPTYDSTWIINGKQLYRYKLTTPYTITTVGTYPIKVVAQNPTPDGCSGQQEISYDLQVFDRPAADFSFTNNGCLSDSVRFLDNTNTNGRPAIRWNWNFDDGNSATIQNPAHLYLAPGNYNVKFSTITDIGCLSDTIVKPVVLTMPAIPKFGASTPLCVGRQVTFTDSSVVTNSPIVKWYWNFGDGSPQVIALTNTPQVHTYATTGTYTATLKVETASGCLSTVYSKTITINAVPFADFSFGNACLPAGNIQFTNLSTISDGTQSHFTYQWTFGDGSPNSSVQNPSHNYNNTGPFNVTLLVTSNNGCTKDTIKSVATIFAQPHAVFGVDSLESCLNGTVRFTDTSSAAGSSINQWYWNFGDGSPIITTQNATHVYTTAGTYIVKHYVTSAVGCASDTATNTITVFPLPTVSFTTSPLKCEGQNVQFTSTSTSNGGTINQYNWTINGTASGTTQSINYTPAGSGNYTVILYVATSKGCHKQATQTININPRPVPNFTLPTFCLPSGSGTFTNQTTVSDGSSLTYVWNFGDGSATSTQTNPSHVYTSTGPFNVQLIATSANGCSKDTIKALTTVYAQPLAKFGAPAEVCFGTTVNFSDSSSAANSTVTQWSWDFGDGSPVVTLQNPTHNYTTPGSYQVTLNVTSAAGCVSNIARQTVVVNPLPTASFTASSPNCVNGVITFTNTSTANAGSLTGWVWNFGDGSPLVNASTGVAQTHTYTSVGVDTVNLQVTSNKGCISAVYKLPITIHALPFPNFSLPDNCPADPFSIFNDSTTISGAGESIASYLWNFGDPNATGANPNTATVIPGRHRYAVAGTYTVSLTTTSNFGCTATASKQFILNGALPTASFSIIGGNQFCSSDSVRIINNSSVSPGRIVKIEIYWDYINDPTNKSIIQYPVAGQIFAHLYPSFFTPVSKTYTIQVFAYSGDNCLSPATPQVITVKAIPQIQFGAITPVCANNAAFQLNASVSNLLGTGSYSGSGVTVTGVFSPAIGAGTYTITYTFNATNGCSASAQQPVTIYPVPTVDAGPDLFVLEGGSATVLGSGTGNNITYLWTPNRWLNNTIIAQPTATPTDDITYTLTVTSSDGCTASDQVFVKVLKAPTIPNTFSPNHDGQHDTWVIKYLDTYPDCTVEIYNRYGQIVFQSTGYSKPWDGTYKGQALPVGTYYYIINPKHGRQVMTGFVDIIR